MKSGKLGTYLLIAGTKGERARIRARLALLAGETPDKATYLRSLLVGDCSWSGHDLRGAARTWGARYRRQRLALIRRVLGLGVHISPGAGGVGTARLITGDIYLSGKPVCPAWCEKGKPVALGERPEGSFYLAR